MLSDELKIKYFDENISSDAEYFKGFESYAILRLFDKVRFWLNPKENIKNKYRYKNLLLFINEQLNL